MATSDRSAGVGGREALEAVRRALSRGLPPDQIDIARLELEPDGALVLEGEAASVPAKKRALRIAAGASGAPGVVDRLHVRPSIVLQDGEIRDRLVKLFSLDPRFPDISVYEDLNPSPLAEEMVAVSGPPSAAAGSLSLEVRDGVVTLDGSMPSLVRKRLAGAIAWSVPGVRDVINGLDVAPPEADGPDQLEEAVREALETDPLFDDAQVKVGVHGDRVRLTGLVHSHDARRAAEDDAWRVLGVDDVLNEIVVET